MALFRLRRYLRMVTYALELAVAVPLSIPLIAMGWPAILVDRFAEMSVLVSHIPFYLGEHTRYFYYRATLKRVGQRVTFKYGSFCQYRGTSIGDRVVIGYYNALGMVTIGDDVSIGGFVNITSGRHQHSIDDPNRRINQQPGRAEVIRVGSDVWIGSNCVISANIGSRCVIGSGSTVVKDVPDHSIYAGNPARFIRDLDWPHELLAPSRANGQERSARRGVRAGRHAGPTPATHPPLDLVIGRGVAVARLRAGRTLDEVAMGCARDRTRTRPEV